MRTRFESAMAISEGACADTAGSRRPIKAFSCNAPTVLMRLVSTAIQWRHPESSEDCRTRSPYAAAIAWCVTMETWYTTSRDHV